MAKSLPVFVIATQRSGTNFLRGLLRESKIFFDFDEIFHSEIDENNLPSYAYFDWSQHSYFKFRANQFAASPNLSVPNEKNVAALFNSYLDYLSDAAGNYPYFLMDVKYNSLHHFDLDWQSLSGPRHIFKLMESRNCTVIHLVRENFFNVYLSEQISHVTRRFVKTVHDNFEVPKITINLKKMFWNLERIEREVSMVRNAMRGLEKSRELAYESLSSGVMSAPGGVKEALSELFRVELRFDQPPANKRIIEDRWAAIVNANEVRSALESSKYHRFVQES